MEEYYEEKKRNAPVDPKTLVKQQFIMSKSQAVQRKGSKFIASVTILSVYLLASNKQS